MTQSPAVEPAATRCRKSPEQGHPSEIAPAPARSRTAWSDADWAEYIDDHERGMAEEAYNLRAWENEQAHSQAHLEMIEVQCEMCGALILVHATGTFDDICQRCKWADKTWNAT